MKILAIDTATRMGSVAILEDRRLLAELYLDCDLTYSERLLKTIEMTLEMARLSLDDISGLAVAQGPGSFTGLRIGLATMKGLAEGKNLPLVGVSSLEALALHGVLSSKIVVPVLDARRGELYAAAFRFHEGGRRERLMEDAALPPEKLMTLLQQWHQPYCLLTPSPLVGEGWGEGKICPYPMGNRACYVGWLAEEIFQKGVAEGAGLDLVPNYLRGSDAEKTKMSS